MKDALISLLKGKHTISDIWHYFLGNYRYNLYFSVSNIKKFNGKDYIINKHPLMRRHIWEQISFRIKVMNPQCYEQGSCIKCGCETPALQMASKTCKGNCYPPMMSRKLWKRFKDGKYVAFKRGMEAWSKNQFTGGIDKFVWNKETQSYNIVIREVCLK